MSQPPPMPQKVLMTTDTVGGVWNSSLELARGLGERGVEVALATLGAPINELQRDKLDRIPGLRVFESHFKAEWMEDPWRDVEKAGDWLLNLESRISPEVVHLNGYVHAALPWSAPVISAGHSCVLSWWRAVKGEEAPESWDRYQMEVAAGLRAADLVVAPSASRLASLAAFYGEVPRTCIIPNGRDAGLFRPAAKEPMVFSCGRLWDEADNLEALERVADRLPWPIFVAGGSDRPEGSEIRPHATRLLGRLSQRALAAWIGRASIFAFPARYDPFGLTVLEAALGGCALVLGDIPSLREIWGHRALFVPPNDPDALEREILALINAPERRQSLAAGARSRALELTPERMVSGYLAAYGEVLAARAPAADAFPRDVFEHRVAV